MPELASLFVDVFYLMSAAIVSSGMRQYVWLGEGYFLHTSHYIFSIKSLVVSDAADVIIKYTETSIYSLSY